jgi:oligoribonuclease
LCDNIVSKRLILKDLSFKMAIDVQKDPLFSADNLIWVDMEMTGLQPEVNRVIEVAAVITDAQLNVIHECPVIAIRQSARTMGAMDAWNTETHGRSGLIDRVLASEIDEEKACDILLAEFARFVPQGKSPMCGNSIGQDRRFMARWMPRLESYFHYRNIDVSTFKELARRWAPAVPNGFKKSTRHEALSDILESIDELKHYRQHLMKC